MIVLFNALACGFEHVPFDAALVASVAHAFPGEPIHYFGEREHVTQTERFLQARAPGVAVTWRPLALPPTSTPPRERLAQDFRTCRLVLAEARRLGASRVIGCYLHAITGTLAVKALSLLPRSCQLAFVYHGNMMRLLWNRRFRPLLSLGNRRVVQLALGDSIRDELLQVVPRLRGSLRAIRHPYFFPAAAPSDLAATGPLTFSYLGMVDVMKGFPEFVEMAAALAADSSARFDFIGGVPAGAFSPGSAVKTYVQKGHLPRDLYERQLGQSSYAVFPYKPDYYKLVASGAVLDAFAAGKPVIALRNSQFEEMFRTMGDIGYLCEDMAGMRSLISTLARERPAERYRRQSEAVLAGRTLYGPEAVGRQLREALV